MALDVGGYVAISQGDYRYAQSYFERELALHIQSGDQPGIATGLRACGFTAMQMGNLAQAQQFTAESLVVSQGAGDRWGAAWSLYDLGYLALQRQELGAAQALLEESIAELRAQGIVFGLYRALFALAQIRERLGDVAQAHSLYQDALRIQQQMHYIQVAGELLESFAAFSAKQGQLLRAARLFGAAAASRETSGMRRFQHLDGQYEQNLAQARSMLDTEVWQAAWLAGSALTLEQAVEEALQN